MPKMTRSELVEMLGEDASDVLAYFADAPVLFYWSCEDEDAVLEYDNLTSMLEDAEEIFRTEDGAFRAFNFDGYRFALFTGGAQDAFYAPEPLAAI